MHVDEIALSLQLHRVLVGGVVFIPMEHDFAAQGFHGLHFDVRGGLGHDDGGGNASLAGRERHALRMIAG
jgi:hypothetical protein